MEGRLPTPRIAFTLFLITFVLNLLIGAILISISTDIGLLLSEPLAVLLPTLLLTFALRFDVHKTLRLRLPSLVDVLLALPLAFSLIILNDQLTNLTSQIMPLDPDIQEGMVRLLRTNTPYEWIVKILGIGVGAAVAEEVLFRGFIQRGLEQGLRRPSAILLTSFLFAVMHLIPQGIPSYLLAGIVLGITALATESIVVPVIIHFIFNMSALVMLNVADVETLGQPIWIPSGILVPALLIFGMTLGYYVRKIADLPEQQPSLPTQTGTPFVMDLPSESDSMARVPAERRRLGWLAVGCAIIVGTLIILSLFAVSLYNIYSREIHASWIETIQLEIVRLTPESERTRVEEGFVALSTVNERGTLSLSQIGRLNWIYIEASSDGKISSDEVDTLLAEIRSIVQNESSVKHL